MADLTPREIAEQIRAEAAIAPDGMPRRLEWLAQQVDRLRPGPERPDHEGDPAESVHYPPLRGEPPMRGVRIPGRD